MTIEKKLKLYMLNTLVFDRVDNSLEYFHERDESMICRRRFQSDVIWGKNFCSVFGV
jgi:hypothetical protein